MFGFNRVIAAVLAALLIGGCACRAKKSGDENVPVAGAEGDLKDVHFAFDSYELDATAKSVLAANAEWLKNNPGVKVQVEGHCDERGTKEYNMALGQKRAQAVVDHHRSLGIDASRVSTVSYGEELPLDPGHDEAAYAKNRRAHHNVLK